MVINRTTLSRHRRKVGAGLSAALLGPALLAVWASQTQTVAAGVGTAGHPASSATATASATATGAATPSASATDSPDSTTGPSAPRTTPAAKPPLTGTSSTPSASAPSTTAPGTPGTPGTPQASKPLPPPAGSVLHSTGVGGRTVALTFDDGPGPATGQILDLLAQYGAHATFCQIGKNVVADPAATKRILAEGHRLCDHTEDHPQPMHTLSHDQQVAEIADAKDAIVKAGGPGTKVTWWRAPGGDFTAENVQIGADNGMKSLGWTVDPRDWSRPGVPAIVANVEQNLKPGGVVLMHDGGGDRSQTVAALKQLLPWLAAQGYTITFPAS